MKRTPIRRVSKKRAATFDAREACVRAVLERDQVCQFPARYEAAVGPYKGSMVCSYVMDAHEPAKRSGGADPTKPEECVLLCRTHHELIHQNPALGERLGLLERHG